MPRVVPSQVVETIDKMFPNLIDQKDTREDRKKIKRSVQNEAAALIELVKQIPSELITLDADTYIIYQMSIAEIQNTIPIWKTKDYELDKIRGHGYLNPVTIIRNALSKCPDEGIAQTTANLNFISDPDLREILRIDISSSNQAFSNGELKHQLY